MAFNPSINPLTFQSDKIATAEEQSKFLFKLATFLSQMQGNLNAVQNQIQPLITPATQNLGALSGNTTFNAAGALVVSITFTFAVNLTLTIQNLPIGSILQMNIDNTAGTAKTLTGAATTPAGISYTSWLLDAGGTQKNMLTGWSVSAGNTWIVVGTTMAGPAINQVAV